MSLNTIDGYEKLAKEAGSISETTRKALALSIEKALRHFFRVSDCLVDMERQTANVVFLMPRHQQIIQKLGLIDQVLPHDILPVTFDLTSLPQAVKTAARILFPETLRELQREDEFSIWKRQARRIITGVIRKRRLNYVEVDLNGAVGILPRNSWVPSERRLYRAGTVLFFQVAAVKRHPTHVSIRLSRASINLPALLLEFYLPMHQFVCVRRFIGQKSMVRTDAKVRNKDVIRIREKVSRELQGEIIELRPF